MVIHIHSPTSTNIGDCVSNDVYLVIFTRRLHAFIRFVFLSLSHRKIMSAIAHREVSNAISIFEKLAFHMKMTLINYHSETSTMSNRTRKSECLSTILFRVQNSYQRFQLTGGPQDACPYREKNSSRQCSRSN